MPESLDQAPPSLRRFATAQICLSVTPGSHRFGGPWRSPCHTAVITVLEEDPRRRSLPRLGRTDGNLVGVAVEPEDGWRWPALMRHPRGGKMRGHYAFQIAPSSSRSLGVEAPLRKVKLAAPAVLGPVTRWRQHLARSSAVRAQWQAKERDGENIFAHSIVVGPGSHKSGVSEIFNFVL
jgi:hypothetical protein